MRAVPARTKTMCDFPTKTACAPGCKKSEHPGVFLARCYLQPLKISQSERAQTLGISRRRINEIVQGRRAISADTALRLARHFQTPAMFWLEKQQRWDLYQAQSASKERNLPQASNSEKKPSDNSSR